MELEDAHPKHRGTWVFAIVVVGMGVLGVAGFLVYKKRHAAGAGTGSGVTAVADAKAWCDLRREWAKKVDPLGADILLKGAQDKAAGEKVYTERNATSQEYAKKLRALIKTDANLWTAVQPVEAALIKEGKVRSNIAVEISNQLAQKEADAPTLRKAQQQLKTQLEQRIKKGRADADDEVGKALGAIAGCTGIYRGPMLDDDMADNPYISWEELEFRRGAALKALDTKLRELEPQEEFVNRVYHELIRRYGTTVRGCLKQRADLKSFGLQIRLKKSGDVMGMAVPWAEPAASRKTAERMLDCMLKTAAKWKFPKPSKHGEAVVATMDLSKI